MRGLETLKIAKKSNRLVVKPRTDETNQIFWKKEGIFTMFSNENTTRTITAEEIGTWRVKELKNFCKEHKIRGYSKLRKAELIALITDFLKAHATEKSGSKSQLSMKPAPLTERFKNTGMREYLKRRKVAEEKEAMRCWRAVLLTLNESGKAAELQTEIDAAERSIALCEQRIAQLETHAAKINFSETVSKTANYIGNFRQTLATRKRKAA